MANMADNRSIADEVSGLIERNVCIRRLLPLGLVNVRALARHLRSKSRKLKEASLDAVISGIRRTSPQAIFPGEEAAMAVAANFKISLRNRVAVLILTKSEGVRKRLPEFVASLKTESGEILRLVEGTESIKMIIDEHNLGKAEKTFHGGIVETARGVAEIEMTHPPDAVKTPGIVAAITAELSINGINLVDVATCPPGIMFVVHEKDAPKAYEVLCGLSGGK